MDKLTPVREARLRQVYQCIDRAGADGASIQDVAKCLSIGVTPYLREMLDQVEALNWVRKESGIVQTGRGARMGWRYYVVPEG